MILKTLDLSGAHRVVGKATPQGFVIFRLSIASPCRVRWQRPQQRLIFERQTSFSLVRLIHSLHFRGGYDQTYLAYRTWAVIVDLVAASLLIWVISGIYIWLRSPRYRLSRSVALFGGIALFAVLVWQLCL